MPREDTEESLHDAAWDQMAIAASQPPYAAPNAPEALFHLLDKIILLQHLRELAGEKTVNGEAFYKTHVKGKELNQTHYIILGF
jgi:hypothetical protein